MNRLPTAKTQGQVQPSPKLRELHPQGKKGRSLTAVLPSGRLAIVWGTLVASSLGIAVNLFRLQVLESSNLLAKARAQQTISLRLFVPRRPIVDRAGNVLAIDRPTYTLYAHPKLFDKTKLEIAQKLAPILERSPQELVKQFGQKNSGIQVAYGLSEDVADRIDRLRFNGLESIQQYSRLYPQTDVAADVIGYVDTNHRGQAGVEYSQEKFLERTIRQIRLSRSANGQLLPEHLPPGFLHFDDLQLQLTIDARLQRTARLALKEQMQKFKAKRGTVIVMDARDGSLLALVSEPTYDPNKYYKYNLSLFKNWALADLYEPGSTFKPINVAIALENHAIKPTSVFNDPGGITVGGWQIGNAQGKRHGSLTIPQILQYSSNVGMVQVMQQVKPVVFYDWLERLGLGKKVAIDLPFEASGQMKNKEQFASSPIEPATAAFGQGLSLTPIQLATLHASLANGGKIVTPHVVQGLFNSQGQMYWQPNIPAPRQVFSPSTSQTVLEMMETVVTKGTGKPSQIPGFRVAGKTGTAQKASPTGGYLSNAKITSFVGILPVDGYQRYVVLAVVDEPKDGPQGTAFGSTVAAPVVKTVMEALINIEQIPPANPQDLQVSNK
jgi:cell division protein FtsI (penicillin-binding protein 3)